MAEHDCRNGALIDFSPAAAAEFTAIDKTTARMWGKIQAERYMAFLDNIFAELANDPHLGKPATGHPGIRIYIAKFRKRRNAHGHRILYRQIDGGIRIIRILHTAMHWPDHLGD